MTKRWRAWPQTARDRNASVWRAVSSHSSHHRQEVLMAQLSLYVHKDGLKPHLFIQPCQGDSKITLNTFQIVVCPLCARNAECDQWKYNYAQF